ncbi:MAG: hypothetical protein ACI4AK_00370, partial [Lepagella sp.]
GDSRRGGSRERRLEEGRLEGEETRGRGDSRRGDSRRGGSRERRLEEGRLEGEGGAFFVFGWRAELAFV